LGVESGRWQLDAVTTPAPRGPKVGSTGGQRRYAIARKLLGMRFRLAYCAAVRTGFYAINLYLPAGRNMSGVDIYAHRDPPGTMMWWANFPARDCFDKTLLQSLFVSCECRQPAHPR
jgi:hypothetical protein